MFRILSITRRISFRIVSLACVGIYILGLLSFFSTHIPGTEQIPTILAPTKAMKQLGTNVSVGLHISGFPIFSFSKNEFLFDGVLWFRFLAGTESLASLENFEFEDSEILPNNKMIYKSDPIIKFIDHDVLVCYNFQALVKGHLNYRQFPIGDHKLVLKLHNKNISAHEMCLYADQDYLTLADDMLIYDWQVSGKEVITGYTSAMLNEQKNISLSYPSAIFVIDFDNVGIKHLISLYFPLLVLFFIGLFSLFFELESESRLTFIAASVPILVLFRMVIDAVSPQVGYTTHIDFFYNLLVGLSLIILFFQAYIMLIMRKIKTASPELQKTIKRYLEYQNDLVFIGSLCLLIILVTYSFYR